MAKLSSTWGNNQSGPPRATGSPASGGGGAPGEVRDVELGEGRLGGPRGERWSDPDEERREEADLGDEGEAEGELDLGDPVLDESLLPELDIEDAEALRDGQSYDDLLDHDWLERTGGEELDDEPVSVEDAGITIELDDDGSEDDAQVVDLDVGALLTQLPDEPVEHELDERAEGALGLSASMDLLLPLEDSGADDREVGDDERFPVFDDLAALERRRPGGDADPLEDPPHDEGPAEDGGDG